MFEKIAKFEYILYIHFILKKNVIKNYIIELTFF